MIIYYYMLSLSECGISCHKRCQSKVPNLCGVNEKLLAEALRNVKEEKKIRTRLEVGMAYFTHGHLDKGRSHVCACIISQ